MIEVGLYKIFTNNYKYDSRVNKIPRKAAS